MCAFLFCHFTSFTEACAQRSVREIAWRHEIKVLSIHFVLAVFEALQTERRAMVRMISGEATVAYTAVEEHLIHTYSLRVVDVLQQLFAELQAQPSRADLRIGLAAK